MVPRTHSRDLVAALPIDRVRDATRTIDSAAP